MHRNALRLLKLVNTLLDFSRIEAGRVQAVFEPIDLAALTARAGQRVPLGDRARRAAAASSTARRCCEPVYVDREMWEKIVLNLLSNAFKFTFEGEIARDAARSRRHASSSTVRDTGTGIPADELPHVFERFHRVRGARGADARGHGHRPGAGAGAGAAARRHDRRVESELGAGTHVHGHASRSAPRTCRPSGSAPPRAEPRPRTGAARLRRGGAALAARRGRRHARPRRRRRAASRARPRILRRRRQRRHARLPATRLLGSRLDASRPSATATTALDGARGARRPDLVLDRRDDAGPRRLRPAPRAARGRAHARPSRSILLSARAGEEARVEGLEAGADDYLVKPFSARELVARVDTHLELARVRRAAEAEVQDAHERLEAALETGRMIAWDWDLTSGISSRSRTAPQLLGLPVQGEPRAFYDLVEPEDRPGVESRIAAAIADGTPYEAEFRVRMPGGETRWLGERGRVRRDNDGRPVRFVGVTFDFTERKQIEAALRDSEARLLADLAAMAKLQEVSTRLVQTSDPAALLLEIVDAAIAVTGADMGNIQLLDHASGRLRIVASRGFDRPFLEFFDTVQEGHAACGMAHADPRARRCRRRRRQPAVSRQPGARCAARRWCPRRAGHPAVRPPRSCRGGAVDALSGSAATGRPGSAARRSARPPGGRSASSAPTPSRASSKPTGPRTSSWPMLGHELRNPLGAISNAVAVLSKIGPQDEQLLQLRAIITRQAQQLTRLVDDLLDVTPARGGQDGPATGARESRGPRPAVSVDRHTPRAPAPAQPHPRGASGVGRGRCRAARTSADQPDRQCSQVHAASEGASR